MTRVVVVSRLSIEDDTGKSAGVVWEVARKGTNAPSGHETGGNGHEEARKAATIVVASSCGILRLSTI
jgi:hypothetical protein